jgi:hypothetical protein
MRSFRSYREQAVKQAFPKKTTSVVRVEARGRAEKILAAREKAREFFLDLDESFTHLFFLDSDVILPKSAIAKLILLEKPLATGVYLSGFKREDGAIEIKPCIYKDLGDETATHYKISDVLKNETLPVGAAGMGCTLLERHVVEKVLFTRAQGEDIAYYRLAAAGGFEAVAHCEVQCFHMQYPMGDEMNAPYYFSKYKVEE